jgi:signal transduction histidine kinase/CheY-like chemotaxis protein
VVDSILEILPETNHVFVILGNSPLDRYWREAIPAWFSRFEGRLTFSYSDGMSFSEILERSASLPPNSAILYFLLSVDFRNVPIAEAQGLPEIHAVANAPIFGLHSSQLGRGVIGGNVMSMDLVARNTAAAAVRLLRGESGRTIQIPLQLQGPPTFDARELRRWNVDEQRLPPGSIVLFREPTLWDRYWPYIVAAIALWTLGISLVAALLFNLVRRRRAEQSLRESTRRLQGILDTAIEGILTVDEHGVIESANAAAENMFGYSSFEAVGLPVSGLISGKTGHRKDGSTFPIDVGVSELALAQRRISTHFVRDVTERARMEQMDREFSRRLLEAQEAERARVARELHDDVTQRLARLTIEAGRIGGPTLRGLHDELVRVNEDVHALAYRLHPSLLDRLGLARALSVECERFSRQHSIPIAVTIYELPQSIPHDVALGLFRIAQEALTNVSRHARASSAAVALSVREHDLRLTVSDTGVGFAVAQDPERPSLGIASMRERARLLGGDLALESAPGRGTTVRAWVPLKTAVSAPTPRTAQRPSVLLADDNQAITEALRDVLAPELEVVATVRNGLALLDAAAKLEPDVIVADISMPLLDGFGALAQLRRRNPAVRVVLITMYQEPALARAALDDGACGFVLKSFAPSELLAAIRAALAGQTYVSPSIADKIAR